MESMENMDEMFNEKKEEIVKEVINRLIDIFNKKSMSVDIEPNSIESKFCEFITDTLSKNINGYYDIKKSLLNEEEFERMVKIKLKEANKKTSEITFRNGNTYTGKYLLDQNIFIIFKDGKVKDSLIVNPSEVYNVEVIE